MNRRFLLWWLLYSFCFYFLGPVTQTVTGIGSALIFVLLLSTYESRDKQLRIELKQAQDMLQVFYPRQRNTH